MALVGRLDEFRLPHIIGLLQVEKLTGELTLEQNGSRAALYFRDGVIVHAVAGKESGYQAALVPFTWQEGQFHFEGYVPEIEPTITASNTAIVAAGRRLAEEAQEARARITTMNLVVRVVPQIDSPTGPINLSFAEWRFLTLVDGRRDLRALAAQIPCSDFEAQMIANRLVKGGLIELQDARQSMLQMVVMPISQDPRPPADPWQVLMDDLMLDLLIQGSRATPGRVRVRILAADDRTVEVPVEGRPSLANRLLVSDAVMARLAIPRETWVHVRLVDETP